MKKVGIAAVIAGAVLAVWSALVRHRESATIGIIGGADGPTAIFVAGNAVELAAAGGVILGAALLTAGAFILWKRR